MEGERVEEERPVDLGEREGPGTTMKGKRRKLSLRKGADEARVCEGW